MKRTNTGGLALGLVRQLARTKMLSLLTALGSPTQKECKDQVTQGLLCPARVVFPPA